MAGCSLSPFSYLCFGGSRGDEHTHVLEREIEKFLVYTSDVLAM